MQLDPAGVISEPGADLAGAVRGLAVQDEMDLVGEVAREAIQEAAHHVGVEGLGEHHEVHPALCADRGHRVDREPVARTAHDGRAPLGAPGAAGDLVGADADQVGEEHLAALRLRPRADRGPGLLPPDADRFRVLLHGPLVRTLEGQAPPAQVLTHALFGQPHPAQLRDQIPHPGARPQLPGQPQVAGTVIQYSLPDRPLLDRTENLVFADLPPAWPGHKRVAPAGQLLRPPVVHRFERNLEHRRDILAGPARHQRGHRPQPKSLLRRRRQLPCIPHSSLTTGINDPEQLPFRINKFEDPRKHSRTKRFTQ